MKNKKGFTLVELLAVIVILAVVMLIAVTSVGPMMEKSRKSSLGDEGVALVKAADTAYRAEGLKGPKAEYNSTTTVCYDLKYLCDKGYFEKGCGSDGYTGSVLVEYKDGKYNYKFWLSNGTYTFNAATKENYGDIENIQIVYNGPEASTNCGETSPSSAPSEAVTVNNEIKNTILHGSVAVKTCKDGECGHGTGGGTPESNEIIFTIDGNTFRAEKNMTWNTWVNSEYNTGTPFSVYTWHDFVLYSINYHDYYVMKNGIDIDNSSVIEANGVYTSYECFEAGTKVLMANGIYKNIEDIKVGDMVMSLNEDTGKYFAQEVKYTHDNKLTKEMVYVTLSDGTMFSMTSGHPLLTTDGYKSVNPSTNETRKIHEEIKKLQIGDEIVGINGNATITNIENRGIISTEVYNLTLDEYHNFVVEGYVAHNAPAPC